MTIDNACLLLRAKIAFAENRGARTFAREISRVIRVAEITIHRRFFSSYRFRGQSFGVFNLRICHVLRFRYISSVLQRVQDVRELLGVNSHDGSLHLFDVSDQFVRKNRFSYGWRVLFFSQFSGAIYISLIKLRHRASMLIAQ